MATAQLGSLSFHIDPDQIHYAYQIDYTTIDTLGGQVVQILGSTTGDVTIAGHFGQDHKNKQESWQLAESFHAQIRALMDAQTLPPKKTTDPVHQPISFTYLDGVHNWNMKVLIKGISDLDGNGSIEHSNGKFSYGYKLTLFIVEDSSLLLNKVASDKFISRIANGVGWKYNKYNGSMKLQEVVDFIQKHSTDGSYQGYLAALIEGNPIASIATKPNGQTK